MDDASLNLGESLTNRIEVDGGWGGQVNARYDLGVGAWFNGAFSDQITQWSFDGGLVGGATDTGQIETYPAPFRLTDHDWAVGGSLGLVVHGQQDTTDVHVTFERW